ncbi:MAG TPA: YceI family protein [Candidatus Acidoferrum sp.]|jgi:polyisoprenoid-binding protein YceI
MKLNLYRLAVAAGLAAALIGPGSAATTTYQIDPRHSSAGFGVTHLMISTVRGEFHTVNGTVVWDDNDPGKSSVNVTIDATTVDTQEPGRDSDLKSPNFFDVAKFPTITFKSTKVEAAGPGKLKVTGDLTIHGVTKQVVLDVNAPKSAIKDPWGMTRSAAAGSTKVNRKDFGLVWNKNLDGGGVMIGDDVDITLDVEMIVPPPAK